MSVYRELLYGSKHGLIGFCGFELYNLVARELPGLLGFGVRGWWLPHHLAACEGRPVIAKGVTIRRPTQLELGRKITVDEYAALDVRDDNGRICLGSHCLLGKFSSLIAKGARIELGNAVNISSHCRIATQSGIRIGESTLIAAYAYIGPGNHRLGEEQGALIEQDMELKGGVEIGSHCWIGTRATILDGVRIGDHAVVGAHALVKDDVPPRTMVAGVPARIIREL